MIIMTHDSFHRLVAAPPIPHDSAAFAQATDPPEEPERVRLPAVRARLPQQSGRNTQDHQRPANSLAR